jgi:hypothetical protein
MRTGSVGFFAAYLLLGLFTARSSAQSDPPNGRDFSPSVAGSKVPAGVILVKGAWSSASDSVTPVPEGGRVTNNIYSSSYFHLSYTAAPGWTQKYYGPPSSDNGYYVLAQFKPLETSKAATRGTILITAQDLFFTLTPVANALEWADGGKDTLQADYKIERQPTPVTIANHSFVRFDYGSPVAELHWSVLTTQIRCHVVQFIFTSRDTQLTENLIQQMNEMKLPAEASPVLGSGGGDEPVCIKDYARDENIVERVDPVFIERRYNPIPVRIIIDTEGKVKHIHFLSAFPDQAKSISEALSQWRFKPYQHNGKPEEVETGLLFGHAPRIVSPSGE